ncbi:dolichol kinase [Thecaphora frezii]
MMERSWSADTASPFNERTSFDLAKPRKHARRLSNQESKEGIREWRRSKASVAKASASSAFKRRSQDLAQSSAVRTRPSPSGLLQATQRQSATSKLQKRHSLPDPLANDHWSASKLLHVSEASVDSDTNAEQADCDDLSAAPYSSATYAAGPSGEAGTGYISSSDDGASTSEFEGFGWDVAVKRSFERPRTFQNHLQGHRPAFASPAVGQGSSGSSSGQKASRASARKTDGNSSGSRGLSPKKATLPLPEEAGPSSPRLARASTTNGQAAGTKGGAGGGFGSLAANDRRLTPPASPAANESNAQNAMCRRRLLRINPTIEGLIMVACSGAAYYSMAHDAKPETRCHAFEFGAITVASALYFFARSTSEQGAIWATDHRNYRVCSEDGALIGLLVPPVIAATSLLSALDDQTVSRTAGSAAGEPLPRPPWMVEGPPRILHHDHKPVGGMTSLVLSRYNLISLTCFTSTALLCHLLATKWIKRPQDFPRCNWRRLGSFTVFASVLTILLELTREFAMSCGIPLWANMDRWEIITCGLLFQANLYTISRLARKSFTLGELGIVAAVGVTLTMETIHLSLAKLLPVTTPYIKTFRRPTPLLIYQLALVVGTFIIGFLLSPLLYLSRNLAQKPTHRLRWPDKRNLHRRLLAGFFYFFAAAYIVGVLGMWVRWMLVKRDPWIWVFQFLVKGPKTWSRLLLVAYWGVLVSGSILGWQMVVARAKRYRSLGPGYGRAQAGKSGPATATGASKEAQEVQEPTEGMQRANGAAAKLGQAGAAALSKDGGTTTIKKAVHLSLNARRKFFHALAVLLFVPGIAFDPAFTHLAFSLAFSIFIFAEYVRYYALYPFGASLHVFMSEFLDHKDSGPVILSHFYLLTGCAAPLWLEGRSQILHQSGVLVLGVGDALASVVGRRYGRIYWPSSSKTVEGSAAFFASIVGCAWLLRSVGLCEHFSLGKYSFLVAALGLLEGVSDQNDNLLLPIFAVVIGYLIRL